MPDAESRVKLALVAAQERVQQESVLAEAAAAAGGGGQGGGGGLGGNLHASASRVAPSPFPPPSSEQAEREALQNLFLMFLHHIASNKLSGILYSETNVQALSVILERLIQYVWQYRL